MTTPESGREPSEASVTLTFSRRTDGGLRVYGETLPGLFLSGLDHEAVLHDIGPVIKALLEHRGEWPGLGAEQAEGERS